MKHDEHEGPDLSPEDQRIQALLRSVRVDAPVPDDVARRLDATLADLQAARTPPDARTDGSASVTALGTRAARRRQPVRVALGLAAGIAAAVGIGGVVLPQLTAGAGADSSVASSQAGSGEAADSGASRPQLADGGAEAPLAAAQGAIADDLPRLRRSSFGADVQDVLAARSLDAAALSTDPSGSAPPSDESRSRESARAAEDALERPEVVATMPADCDAGVAPGPRADSFVGSLGGRPVLVVVRGGRASAYACNQSVVTEPPQPVLTRRLG